MKANVKFMIDRAGLVPEDGDTHQGVFDISFLRIIPNIVIMSPVFEEDFKEMVKKSIEYKGPTVIRYNKSAVRDSEKNKENIISDNFEIGKAHIVRESHNKENNKKNCIISYGQTLIDIVEVVNEINFDASILNLSTLKPLDEKTIIDFINKSDKILIIEESLKNGGIGSAILELMADNQIFKPVKIHALPNKFFEVATRVKLLELYKLDKNGIKEVIIEYFN